MLRDLGITDEKNLFATKPKLVHPRKRKELSKKRKNGAIDEGDYRPVVGEERDDDSSSSSSDEETGRRRQKKIKTDTEEGSLRRSSRVSGKKVDYVNIEQDRSARTKLVRRTREVTSEPRMVDKRTQNP